MSTVGRGLFRLSAEKKEQLRARLEAEGLEATGVATIGRRAPRDGWPLSFSQQRLWFLDQLVPGLAAYNVWEVLSLEGVLRPAALAAALGEVERRHEVLRARFATKDGQPLQTIAPPRAFEVPLVDLGALAPERREAVARRLLAVEVRRPFDLSRGPLLRALLLRLESARHLALLAVHHIATDGWSMGVLIEEVGALYRGFAAGRPAALAPLAIDYADYAAWQRAWLAGPGYGEQLGYWRRQLAELPTVALPTDRPRPAMQTYRGGGHRRTLTPELQRRLAELAREQGGATLFMVLLAVFYAVLYRTTGQRDLVVGSPIANRQRPEIAPLIGFFVNTLVLRTRFEGGWSFRRLLEAVRETAIGAYAHQDLPFEKLVEELAPERDLSHVPLFQVMFALQNAPRPALDLAGLKLGRFELDNPHAMFDLTLAAVETADGLLLGASYNADLFDATRIRRLLGHLERALAAVVADADTPLDALPILPAAERHQLLAEWAAGASLAPLPDLLARVLGHAAARPEAIALVAPAGVVSWAELEKRSARLAAALAQRGIGREAVVALVAERSAALVIGALGVLRAGAAYLPMDPALPPERLVYMAADAGVALVLATAANAERLRDGWAEHTARPFPPVLDPEHVPETVGIEVAACAEPDALAYVIYTSGSTGKPKGTELVHAGLCNLLAWHLDAFGMAPGERATLVAAPGFDASVWELWSALAAGAELHVPPAEILTAPAALVRWLTERRADVSFLPTPLAEAVLAEAVLAEAAAATLALRWLFAGGDRLRAAPPRGSYFRLGNLYGPTEATVISTWATVAPDEPGAPPIGRPLPGFQALLLDRSGRPVPLGVPGELHLGGTGLARGYRGRPGLTAERFVPAAFAAEPGARLYRTGDLARWRADGRLDFLGRIDTQVKVRGFRIELGEIEAALAALPEVREAAVVVRSDLPGGALAGFVVPEREGLEPALLLAALRRVLPEYMVPTQLVALDALPTTDRGKLDRAALLRLAAEQPRGEEAVAPRTPAERRVAETFAEVLGIADVDARGHFFELGGHSLLAAKVVSRLEEGFGVAVSLKELFETPVVETLAARLETRRREGLLRAAPPLVAQTGSEQLPLSSGQERLWFLDRLRPGSSAYNVWEVLRLEGVLDPAIFAAALSEITRRHAVLRARFLTVDGLPVQTLRPPGRFEIPAVDLAALAPDRREREARRLLAREVRRPFDLARGPLLRALLLRLAPERHLALLTIHHIATDGWSMGVLIEELGVLYRGFVERRPVRLAPLPLDYADYAAWQRAWLEGPVYAQQLEYWRKQLAELPTVVLPTDRPRPAVQTYRGGACRRTLAPEPSRRLAELGRENGGATLFMTLLAGFYLLLYRTTGQRDLVVGTPTAGRQRPEVAPLIGFFVNTLVLRTRFEGGWSFRRLLETVRETAVGAYAHQDLPFEKLVEELAPERDLSHVPLFQVMFALQNAPRPVLDLAGLKLGRFELDHPHAMFDLTLAAMETADGLMTGVSYNADLFDATRIRRLLGHYQQLLGAAVAAPERALDALPLLPAAERHQLLCEHNAVPAPPPVPDLLAMILAHAATRPDGLAVVDGERHLSLAGLETASARLAAALAARGLGAESLVAVVAPRSAALVIGALGTLRAGAAYLPLDPAQPPARLAAMAADAGARALVTAPETAERVLAAWPEAVPRPPVVDPEQPPPAPPAVYRQPPPSGLAYAIYTSGSTGRPKGIELALANLTNLVGWHLEAFAAGRAERSGLVAAPAFDASVWELWTGLATGVELHVPPAELLAAPAAMLGWLARQRLDRVFLPTPLAEAVLAEPLPAGLLLRWLWVGGDRLQHAPPPGLPFEIANLYGPAETTVISVWDRVAAGEPGPPIGRPVPGLRAHLLDRALRLVPLGVVAELFVGGVGLARGYRGRPGLTAERFLPDPFAERPGERLYRTGDLGRRRNDGRIDCLGRLDGQVKIRGFRIELGEIEAAIAELPQVQSAVVLVRDDLPGGRALVGYWVPRGGADSAAEITAELAAALRRRLPEYMVPSFWVALAELPATAHGKVDRRALPLPAIERGERGRLEPRTAAEREVAAVFAEVLGIEKVPADGDFFELGGHSLLAAKVISRLQKHLGVAVTLQELFETPTVEGLAARIEAHRRAGELVESAGEITAELALDSGFAHEWPLSFSQERLWFLEQLEPGTAAYNMPMAARLRGRLSSAALAGALGAVVERHAVLRTRFCDRDGRPWVEIAPHAPPPLPLLDLARLGGPARDAELERRLAAEAGRPFDLARGGLVRALLVRLGATEHVFAATFHHAVTDGWSMDVFTRELAALYEAAEAGRPSPLEPLPLQYPDFAAWQRRWLAGEVLEAHLAWWRERLGGELPTLALPLDRPRPALQSFRGERMLRRLAPERLEQLLRHGREHGATLFMTLIAAFSVLLGRWAGQRDLLIGVPSAGRTRREIEGLIGFFINTLVLRADLSGEPSFAVLLAQVREMALGAFAHQDVPFEKLVAELHPNRDLARTPLFQVFFNLLNFERRTLSLGEVELEPLAQSEVPSKFDLTLYASESAAGLGFFMVYNADLFSAERMEAFADAWIGLLEQIAIDPTLPIDRYSLRRGAAAEALPDPRRMLEVEPGASLPELFLRTAAREPARRAVCDGAVRWSYAELEHASAHVAAELVAAGVERGQTVAICAERGAWLVAAVLGVGRAGAVFVILDPGYPPVRLCEIAAQARPAALIEIAPAPAELEVARRLRLPPAPERMAADAASEVVLPPLPAPDELAYLAFTSGSAGKPKGILGSHRPVVAFLDWYRRRFALGAEHRFAMLSGLAHDPLLRDLFTPLALGAELHVPPPETLAEPAELWRWLRHEAVAVAHLTPSLAELLLQGAEVDADPLPALRLVLLTGEAVRYRLVARLRERAPAALVVNVYGATETPQVMACHVVEGEEAGRRDGGLVPIGHGRDAVDLLVLGARGEPCAVGEVGEIYVRSPYLALGYLDDEALTRERFLPGGAPGVGIYRTGDLGRYRPGGEVELVGRADSQVKVRGFRVEPAEVEAALVAHPAIAEAVVLAQGDPADEARLVAWVVPAAGAEAPEPEALRIFLRAVLPDYMVPAHVVVLAALPLTPNGKLDRRALPAPDWRRTAQTATAAAPRTRTEARLAEIWSELLGVERVGVHDDFFALGGHSLLATRLAAGVRGVLGASLPLRRLFQAPTIAALAAWLDSEEGRLPQPELAPLVPAPERLGEPFPMTDIQQAYWLGRSAGVELGNVATHSYLELDCPGFDLERFGAAWRRLIDRHAMLRAVMLPDGRQRILEQVPPYEPRVEDLRTATPEHAEAVLAAIRDELSHQVLDPERWPIFELRATLLPGGVVRLHVSRDALLYDAWSMTLILRQLLELYRRPETVFPPLELTFRDYVVAEHALRGGELWERSAAYWRERLDTLPPAPELPLAADPATLGRPVFERRNATLEPELWRRIGERARAAGLTPSVVLLAAYSEVLGSWSKSPRFTLNLTLFNRLPFHPQVEQVVGDFTSVTLLEIDAGAGWGLAERARRIQERLWADLDHRTVGGVWVLRELARRRPGRLRAAMPLVFTSTLGLRRGASYSNEEALGQVAYSITQTPQVWLDHQVTDRDDELSFNWDSVAGLFPAGMVDAMFDAYVGLLHALALEDGAWTTRERCLTPAAQLELRAAINATAAEIPAGLLHEPFRAQAARRPAAPAVIAPARTLSYGELAALANALGRRLRALGVVPGQLVAVVMEKGWEQVAAVLGVLEAGGAYLPIDAAVPPERLALLLESGEVRVALTQPRFTSTLVWPAGVEVLTVVSELAAEAAAQLAPLQRPDDLAYVIYTSGSTGKPKGVAIDHRGALNTIVAVDQRFGVCADDRVLALSALNFDLSVWDVFGVLAAGGAIVLPASDERRDPAHWAELVRRHRVTVWNSVPALAEMFVEHLALDPDARLEALRLVMLSGDWIPTTLPDRLRRLAPGAEVVSLGGATEASIWSILYPIGAVDPAWRSIPYGRAMLNQSFHVLDEGFRPRPVWVPGELYIGGVGLAQGYFKDPERTAASFVHHPRTGERLYRTGDLGRFLPDGTIEFLGREDLQVKVQGHRIELGEIEAALERCPGVRAGVVLAAGEARGPRRLVAFAVTAEGVAPDAAGAAPDADGVRSFLGTKLPAYMVPAVVVFLDQLPLSANGKVDRGALAVKAQHAGELEAEARYVAPRTELEAELAAAWAEVLKLGRVGVEENFFELGGDSIAAIQLSTRLAKSGWKVRPTALFEHQTVAALATVAERVEAEPAESLEPARAAAPAAEATGVDAEAAGLAEEDLEAFLAGFE